MGAPFDTHSIDRLHSAPTPDLPEPLRAVAEALARLRYGVIRLTVHDGKLMQLDVTERRRFT